MILDSRLPSFTYELLKIAFQATEKPPKSKLHARMQQRADKHFASTHPDWSEFEKNLRRKTFREVITSHPGSDSKLKRYTKSYGGYLASKDVRAEVKSKDSGKTYAVKDLHTGRLGCGCKDWQYRRSHGGGDCKHIRSLKQSKMLKKEAIASLVPSAGMLLLSHERARKNWRLGQVSSMVSKQLEEQERAPKQS